MMDRTCKCSGFAIDSALIGFNTLTRTEQTGNLDKEISGGNIGGKIRDDKRLCEVLSLKASCCHINSDRFWVLKLVVNNRREDVTRGEH
jgi:hypothetical protein